MLSDIHQLVHALSKSEKRYFQQVARMHTLGEKNNYLKLFEVLNRQETLHEGDILQTFQGQNFYLLKRHLHKTLLRSMRSFHEAGSVEIQLHSIINETDILSKKGLEKAALKLIHHAKKIAVKHELHLLHVQLLEQEIRLLSSSRHLAQARPRIERVFREAARQTKLYRNFQECLQFRMEISAIHNREILISRPAEQKKFRKEIKRLELLELSQKAQWQLYNGAGTFFSSIGNLQTSYHYHKKAAAISEKTPLVSEDLRQYILSVYSQSISDYYLKNYRNALSGLKNIQNIFNTLSNTANRKNLHELYLHSLLLHGFIRMDMNEYPQALPVIQYLKNEIEEQTALQVSLRNDIYYQQAGFWFCTGHFKEAQRWISKMLQDEHAPKENPARYRFARLIQLLILLEQNDIRQLENRLPATRKFLKGKPPYFKAEQVIMEFLRDFTRSKEQHPTAHQKEKFIRLAKKLAALSKNKNESIPFRVFDYVTWAKAKSEGKTMDGERSLPGTEHNSVQR